MSKCYIPEISIKTIRSNILDELKNKYTFCSKTEYLICAHKWFL